MKLFSFIIALLLLPCITAAQSKSYRLPSVDLKQPIFWGSECEGPDGTGLAFGGNDQASDDGIAHTRIMRKTGDVWTYSEIERNNRHAIDLARILALRNAVRDAERDARHKWFEGTDVGREPRGAEGLRTSWASAASMLRAAAEKADRENDRTKLRVAAEWVEKAAPQMLSAAAVELDRAAAVLGVEPPPRALASIAYDPKTGLYVIFGGDHLDYLMNDTWTFDPRDQRWEVRFPNSAPPPRANHKLKANGDGTISMSGGYTYTSSTDYCGGQYRDLNDGEWVFDIVSNTWTPRDEKATAVDPFIRTYRKGPFHPDFYLEGDKPDREAVKKKLETLAANTWTAMNPPRLPRLNRDWGTATIDPDHDLILRFSGGHSAHGGSDVLHYHMATNRWELCFPVEFPLGQLYTNTEYPQGFNFNGRPWVSGHTYKSYAYDPLTRLMYFTGHSKHTYIYDPSRGDWTGRTVKPAGMDYNDCFYDLVLCPTPRGLTCWTKSGRLFVLGTPKKESPAAWSEVKLTGDKLRGSVVDRCGMAYDSKRDRLICTGKTSYGGKYDGVVYTIDLKAMEVRKLTPPGAETMIALDFLRESIYEPDADLILLGATFAGNDGPRQTPAYDCAKDRWVSVVLGGDDPNGKNGRDVSLGLMYDAKHKLIWAVDTNSQVYVLHLDRAKAASRELP